MGLEDLGYRPELKRNFSKLETFGVAFSIMGVVPSIASTIWYNLLTYWPYGGPVSMVWGWLVAAGLISFIGFAMADLASSMPTSGGLYYWTHRLAPPKYQNFLSWFVGYNSFLGNVAAISSLGWACSGMIFACASIANENFSPSIGAQVGLYIGILVSCGIFCAYGTTLFARLQTPSVVLNVALALVTIIGLPIARRGELNSAKFTFGGWENLTSWPNGFAFLLSFMAPVWTICSFDCAVSISEEASNASIAVPAAIVGAISSAGILGTLILIMIALCMGPSVAAVNDSAIGQPLAYVYLMAFGQKGSLVIWALICVSQVSMTASLILPSSRQAFAFARDGALPFSQYFHHIDSWAGTPVRTVWLVIGAAIPLGFLGFADPENQAAINAIFALAIMGPYVAYGIPIFARIFWKRTFIPGPWYLGRASVPVAWVAVVWMVFAFILFSFPGDKNPSPGEMNYAIVVTAGVWLFATVFWYTSGRHYFTGPRTEDLSDEIAADFATKAGVEHTQDPNKTSATVTVQPVDDDSDDGKGKDVLRDIGEVN
ncbi:uncharacterized protein CcaverHIS019_0700580 [Cutaneotrichosporon cavernicola]|uniref:Amino acid transporter n=1 Tax=Cutaneotrichosporon cavernicola TaxID=279322 RepID=A0AA48QYK6_9TREE|nr:uncharacterized protein CcaverHIS019_0700580 [Cutaneotrichosporon cavernicola]BEI94486.1 hypothetical protein CcaverHIS019_0700580 [Cutaneotrichosporon cavernicola]